MRTQANSHSALRGRRAQAQGAAFENIFSAAAHRQGIVCTRIPDGCKQLPNRRIIRVKSPFDWILSHKEKTALIDTKTIDAAAFPHSQVDPYQAHILLKHELAGTPSGYAIWLRKTDTVVYIPARTLCKALQSGGSIAPEDVIHMGSMTTMDIKKIFALKEASPSVTIVP